MKPVTISFSGICNALGAVVLTAYIGLILTMAGIKLFDVDWTWDLAWKIPTFLVGFAAFAYVCVFFQDLYEKDPSITLGKKKPPKPVFPKARVLK